MPANGKQEVLNDLRARIASLETGDASFADFGAASPVKMQGVRNHDCIACKSTVQAQLANGEGDGSWDSDAGKGTCVPGEVRSSRSEGKDAYAKILRLASVRERSSFDLRARLAREGYDECEIEEALARSQRYGIVDDARFAESFCRSSIAAGKGLSGIRAELEKRGIDPDVVPDAWADDESDEIERAIDLLRRKPPTAKNKRDAAYRKLVQRGFGSSVAATAARTWVSEAEGV